MDGLRFPYLRLPTKWKHWHSGHPFPFALLLYGLVLFLLFSDVLLLDRTLDPSPFVPRIDGTRAPQPGEKGPVFCNDAGAVVWAYQPWNILVHRSLFEHGQIPLWNPYQGTGTPLAANVQSGVFELKSGNNLLLRKSYRPGLSHLGPFQPEAMEHVGHPSLVQVGTTGTVEVSVVSVDSAGSPNLVPAAESTGGLRIFERPGARPIAWVADRKPVLNKSIRDWHRLDWGTSDAVGVASGRSGPVDGDPAVPGWYSGRNPYRQERAK